MLTVTVDDEGLQTALKSFADDLPDAVDAGFEIASKKVLSDAARMHRFKSRTGNLISSLRSSISAESAEFMIDNAQAPYGKYVHEGFKSWQSDPFLQSAVNSNAENITNTVSAAIGKLIDKEGLR